MTISAEWQDHMDTWTTQNPNFEYTLWTDREIEPLIMKRYPQLWDLYKSYKVFAQRTNLAR